MDKITLKTVICPGCASELPKRNHGCSECGYEDNDRGKILPLGELMKLKSFPEKGKAQFHNVSPAFLAKVVEATRNTPELCQAVEEPERDLMIDEILLGTDLGEANRGQAMRLIRSSLEEMGDQKLKCIWTSVKETGSWPSQEQLAT
ncbi:hypothetical protein ACYPKM_02145 [Pseudomonas aeruginosa]